MPAPWKVKSKFKAVQAPPPPPPLFVSHRSLGGTYGSNKTWMVSFTDIMALMLTFFVMMFAMSDHGIPKAKKLGGLEGQQGKSFDGAVSKMGDSDSLPLPRTRYSQGLDVGYLTQIIESKRESIPGLKKLSVILKNDSVLLALPLSVIPFNNGRLEFSENTQDILRNITSIFEAVPNDIEIQVEWRAQDGFSESVMSALQYARQIRDILAIQNPNKNMKIYIAAQGLGDREGDPRLLWRIVPLKPLKP